MPSVPWHHSRSTAAPTPATHSDETAAKSTGASTTLSSDALSSSPTPHAGHRGMGSPSASSTTMTAPTTAPASRASTNDTSSSSVTHEGASSTPASKVIGKLRVQVVGAHNLIGKDRNGLSDPFVVLNLPGAPPPASSARRDRHFYRRTTPVQHKSLNPEWKAADSTFDWDITTEWLASLAHDVLAVDHATQNAPNERKQAPANVPSPKTPAASLKAPSHASTAETISRPSTPTSRPSNVRKISAATGRLLIAPVRISAKGAMATSRVVRRRGGQLRPRPIRLRKGQANIGGKAPTGSAALVSQSAPAVSAVEFVCWDKDKWSGNDYMGECSLHVADWVQDGKSADWEHSEPIVLPLGSSRRHAKVSGEIMVKVGIVPVNADETAEELYARLLEASIQTSSAGIRSVPADQSVGTAGPSEAFVDDGLSSDSEGEMQEELLSDDEASITSDEDGDTGTTEETDEVYDSDQSINDASQAAHVHRHDRRHELLTATTPPPPTIQTDHVDDAQTTVKQPRRRLLPSRLRKSRSNIGSETRQPGSGTTSDVGDDALTDTAAISDNATRKRRIRVRRRRRQRGADDGEQRQQGHEASPDAAAKATRKQRRREANQRRQDFAFKAEQGLDIIGIVQLEVKGAQDLPHWRNSLGTSFDMDAFVIVSFGQRIFRTRVARHSLNPTWDEKLLFHVRRHEANYVTKLAIYDWDKLSSNDYVGETELHIADLVERAPKPDATTGLYAAEQDTKREMETFALRLSRHEDAPSKGLGNHSPVLTVQARYTPYAALRQRFWRQLLRQYDSNDSDTISMLEMMAMLDSLGGTLTQQTIVGLFAQFHKNAEAGDELTIDEAIMALEGEIVKPFSQKRVVSTSATAMDGLDSVHPTPLPSGLQTPALESGSASLNQTNTDEFFHLPSTTDFVGPKAPVPAAEEHELAAQNATVSSGTLDAPHGSRGKFARHISPDASKTSLLSVNSSTSSSAAQTSNKDDLSDGGQVERVIMLKSCPMCRMPRLSKKAEVDIVTHLAVCASHDWRRVDSMMVSNYVTAVQAHRKWVTKVFTKLSQGQYQLGANSANIIVQNRMTGELLEEKMQVYVRLGIRLLYKGARSRMEGARIKRMLKNMSDKQGIKYDSPLSAREIPHFIAFHSLNVDEIRDPLDSFKTFNEFFYRKLKPEARPLADPHDPNTLVSTADCRLMAFSTVTGATQVWIKGRDFTVEKLLGNGFVGSKPGDLDRYRSGGGLVIFRLAPQDYHRFHCPADATVGKITMIEGQYYTVNPMAIRSTIDVYGENVRAIVPFHSVEFGTFYCVCIGAMMVGSIRLSIAEGDAVKRGQEMGYFAFGGSTLVVVFERGRVAFDEDLLGNSDKAIETLVRVGMRIGRNTAAAAKAGDAIEGEKDAAAVDPVGVGEV